MFKFYHFYIEGKYETRKARIYAKRITGIQNDEYELGPWETIYSGENLNSGTWEDVCVTRDYAEFGFSYDIAWGEPWPYSGCFWTIDNGEVKDGIYISVFGETRNPKMFIDVDHNRVVSECNSPGRDLIG